ncbi:MAG: hypothetical protein JWM99_5254 [Verrucomicrobiales bacterium]|nr:hypothetical protein [Verrucomicrobiales bacterium]
MKTFYTATLSVIAMFQANAAEPRVPVFRAVEIDKQVQIGYGVTVADVNGDKKPDIILADKNVIVWYQNPTWEKHIIAEKLTELDNVCVAAADINGDGKAEIAVGAGWNPGDTIGSGAVFYMIPPSDRTQRWEPVKLPHEPTTHRMRWVRNELGKYDLLVVPLHGRGNKNGEGEGVKVQTYRMPADPKESWTITTIDSAQHMTHNFNPLQWDADVANELLLASKEGIYFLGRNGNSWTKKAIARSGEQGFAGAGEVRDGKLKSGSRFIAAIEPMHGNQFVIYSTDKPASDQLWKRHMLDDSLNEGHAVACGDLGSGSDSVVVGWRGKKVGDKVGIKLFTALDAAGSEWKQTPVDDGGMACEDLCLADLNGDGRLDIIASGRATKNVKIYFNEGIK